MRGVVFHDVINVKHARKAAEHGVDGLILVCAGAEAMPVRCRRSRWCVRTNQHRAFLARYGRNAVPAISAPASENR